MSVKSGLGGLIVLCCAAAGANAGEIPRYDHVLVIVAENKDYNQIIGSENAPRLNKLAKEYGLATNYFGVVHPSEANYIAMLGGDTFGIHDDDAWYCKPLEKAPYCLNYKEQGYVSHSTAARSLMDQLEEAKLTWKGYFEDLPAPGSLEVFNPSEAHPDPDRPMYLYAAKHNGFVNFGRVREDPDLSQKIVPLEQLRTDLSQGTLPNYAHIILNQCNEMHGLYPAKGVAPPEDCVLHGRKGEPAGALIKRGDNAIGGIVDEIMAAPAWSSAENIAIVLTWDEDSYFSEGQQGCCGSDPDSPANFGGGHIPAIVVTNHGPRQLQDSTPYNHYSLLRTTEEAFGIREHLGLAAATDKGVKTMAPLFGLPEEPVSANALGSAVR